MGLAGVIRSWIEGGRRPSADAVRATVPVRNPDAKTEIREDGSAVIEAPLAGPAKGMLGALAKAAKLPAQRQFELEQVGAFVWEQIDGKQSFASISQKLRERFKMNRLEADASLAAFLQTLGRKGLVVKAKGGRK